MEATSEIERAAYRCALEAYLRSETGATTTRSVARRMAWLDPRTLGIAPLSGAVTAQIHNTRRLLEDIEGRRPGRM